MLVKYYHGFFMQDESGRKKRALGSCLVDRRPRLTLRRAHDRVINTVAAFEAVIESIESDGAVLLDG